MQISKSLKYIYKANQCTDLADVENALSSLREIAKMVNHEWTKAMTRRLFSLEQRKNKLAK